MSKASARLQRRVRKLAKKWEAILDMPGIEVVHKFHDKYCDEANLDTTVAETVCHWQYRYAKIHWYVPVASTQSLKRLEETLVHEYCHVLLAAGDELVARHEESWRMEIYVENVARALLSVHRTKG